MIFRRGARPLLPLSLATSLALGVPCLVEAGVALPALQGAHAIALATAASTLATSAVMNCADSGPGSLREAITNAADGATIDIPALLCSKITLAAGSLSVTQNNLTVNGPGRSLLQIKADVNTSFPVFAHSGSGLLTISGLRVTNANNDGPSARGGCITSSAGSVRVVAVEVAYCYTFQTVSDPAMTGGGAIYAKSDVTIEDSLVRHNGAYGDTLRVAGGGAFASGNLIVRRSVIEYNSAGVYITPGNEAGYGGALAAKRSIEIVASTVSANSIGTHAGNTKSPRGFGGGVFALNYYGGSTLVLTDSTVSGNGSSYLAGGVMSSAPTHVSNSTIAFNHATNSQNSAAIKVGVGLFVNSEAVTLDSTIIAKNTYSGVMKTYDFSVYNATVSGTRNLITNSAVSPSGTLTSDPALDTLADNGGPTQTHALMPGSPAIGAGGNPLNLVYDQRGPGFSRVFAGFVDIGAFQTGDAIFANGFDPPS